jgi:hypothetical protein
MEATRSVWIAVVARSKPPLRPVLAVPGIVAEGGRHKKARPKWRWREGIPRMHNDATSNENKILHLEVR